MDVAKISAQAIKDGLSMVNGDCEETFYELVKYYACFCERCTQDPHAMLESAIALRLLKDTKRATKVNH